MEQLELFKNEKKSENRSVDWWERPEGETLKTKNNAVKRFSSKEEYYNSEEWQIKRAFALNRANHRCQRCGASHSLEVHHLTYDRLYNERPKDLEVLCKKCHKKADRQRAYNSWYESALDTYLTKKYGEDYDYWDGQEEEFDDWLESKG